MSTTKSKLRFLLSTHTIFVPYINIDKHTRTSPFSNINLLHKNRCVNISQQVSIFSSAVRLMNSVNVLAKWEKCKETVLTAHYTRHLLVDTFKSVLFIQKRSVSIS